MRATCPRSVTARREKVTRYIRVLNELSEVRTFRLYSLCLRVLEFTVRENIARFLEISWVFLLLVFGGSVTDLGVGVWSAVAAPLCSFAGSWGGSWRRTEVWSGARVDPLTRQVPTFWSTGRIKLYLQKLQIKLANNYCFWPLICRIFLLAP